MKKHILLCMAIACTFFKPALAQIEKGKWIGGITLDGGRYKVDGYTNSNGNRVYGGDYIESNFTSSVFINKMVSKKWLLGIGMSHNSHYLVVIKSFQYHLQLVIKISVKLLVFFHKLVILLKYLKIFICLKFYNLDTINC